MTDNINDNLGYKSQRGIVDAVSKLWSPRGELSKSVTNALYGFNHRNVGSQAKSNSDNHGITLVTRPRLNLSYNNIAAHRDLAPLLTDVANSMPRAIRCMLDPVSHRGELSIVGNQRLECPLVDPRNPFMPIISNLLLGVSGWNDSVMDTHTSPTGRGKESWSMMDSLPKDYSTQDITLNLRNIVGDPIKLLFHVWTQVAARCSEGSMDPWYDAIAENEKDYDVRIYRLVLDESKRYVTKIGATNAGFPYVNPTGADFNFDVTQNIIQDNAEISIPMKCDGFQYYDPILVIEFNSLVAEFNPDMMPDVIEDRMVKLKEHEKDWFAHRYYPRISEDSYMELQWWVDKDEYQDKIREAENFQPSTFIV